jgi:hypothetical protein
MTLVHRRDHYLVRLHGILPWEYLGDGVNGAGGAALRRRAG